jgi:hypothetical protein
VIDPARNEHEHRIDGREIARGNPLGVPVSTSVKEKPRNEADTMHQIHPDDASSTIELRHSIIRQGVQASRHPGDLAGMREKIGLLLIAAGKRIQGRQASLASPMPNRAMQPAR